MLDGLLATVIRQYVDAGSFCSREDQAGLLVDVTI